MFEGPAAVTGSVIPASTPTLDIQKHLTKLGGLFANICGYIFLALAVLVTCETLGRKLFNVSLQGVDELGGYVLAVGSSLAFATALVDRAHIRIELFHLKLPQLAQMILNWMSVTLLAAFGALLAWVCYAVVIDSLQYGSTAPTPWATPLIYPQTLWYAAIGIFALTSIATALHATVLLVTGRGKELHRYYGPKEPVEEVKDELESLAQR